ncbi:Sec-independent protein translocase subunit TatA [Rhodococcus pyridinivorans]|uniref:Sec-independent protein translocase protein TatA n=3 Tax=Rhodococcus TaxID=1827 RepID=A0A495N9Z1_9NOCA|nr:MULTISPECIES: Sec-independent protein translocase subunit TatA [Rhodococcus]AOD23245.1 preprotein translocase subunit TatA [Rhodococcus sp. p52]APE09287.1 Sec-independent protein translocase TatA [Rhodococcus sp. 2G]AWZ25270.1 twin-arginine translocase TatA/TatE family subunit [Rhodococcus pyridinivorans]KHJ74131.1 preprotein translocase subunit TatA [Rhodococcus sp. Chr-9]MBX4170040.1 Sec-independent protein translocase subunit TatA [Rhodococcus sp. DMU2021]
MGAMSPWHWAIVALVVVILFGSKKLPDAARGLGRSLRIFKSEVKEMQNDDARASTPQPAPNPLPAAQPTADPAAPNTHTEPRSA